MVSPNEFRKLLMHNTRKVERGEIENEPQITFWLNDDTGYRLRISQIRELRLEEFVERRTAHL